MSRSSPGKVAEKLLLLLDHGTMVDFGQSVQATNNNGSNTSSSNDLPITPVSSKTASPSKRIPESSPPSTAHNSGRTNDNDNTTNKHDDDNSNNNNSNNNNNTNN